MIQDSPTPFRADWLGAAGEESTEETNRAVWVVSGIDDVLPTPLTAIGDWVELGVSARAGDGLGNQRLHDILMEDKSNFILSVLVGRTDVLLRAVGCSTPAVGKNTGPSSASPVVAWHEVIDHVVEPTVTALHAERSKKLTWLGIAEVLLDWTIVTDDSIRSLRTKDDAELRSTIHHSQRIDASAVTNHFHADCTQDSLRQVGRRKLCWEHLGRDAVWIKAQGGVLRKAGTSNGFVATVAEVFVPVAVLPCVVRVLGENIEHHPKLLLTLECETKIVDADRRGVQRGVLQVVGPHRLSEWDHLIRGKTGSFVVRWVVTWAHCGASVIGNSGPCEGIRREGALVGRHRDFGSHFVKPSRLLDELVPRAGIERFLIDVWTDARCFGQEERIDVVSHIFGYPGD